MLIGGSTMEITTDAGSNNVAECSHDGKSETGMFGYNLCGILSVYLSVYVAFTHFITLFTFQFCLCNC